MGQPDWHTTSQDEVAPHIVVQPPRPQDEIVHVAPAAWQSE
jgi:hypothetical protein